MIRDALGWLDLGTGRGTRSKDSFMEGISKGMQSKDSRGFLTQGRDKAIPTLNSGAQMNARKHQLRSRNSKIWCEWSRGSDVMTEGSRRAGHTKPRSWAKEVGPAGFGDTGELMTSFQQESTRSLRWDWNRGRDGKKPCLLRGCQ